MVNLFALLSGEPKAIARVSVTANVQGQLSALFQEQRAAFLSPQRERAEFEAGFIPDEDQLSYIVGYEPPQHITTALNNPTNCDPLSFQGDDPPRIKGVAAFDTESHEILFQAFDRRRVLSLKGFSLVLSGATYRRLVEPGLTLDSKLVAAVAEGRLFFDSYFAAARVLDLTAYYREATREDLVSFYGLPLFAVENQEELVEGADSWTRRKIAAIMESGILTGKSVQEIQKAAKGFENVTVKIIKKRLVLPSDKKELKMLVRFLAEDLYVSVISGTKYLASSKKRMK
jgi:hypothetical protein